MLALALSLAACAGRGHVDPPPTPEPVVTDLSTALDRIAALPRPYTAPAVGEALGVALEPDFATSTPYFAVYQGDGAGVIPHVEVRVAQQADPNKQGMVLVDLAGCASRADVGERFGAARPGPASPLRPGMPADTPAYTSHPQPWGEVRLGWSRTADCLVRVILDANR